MCNHTGRFFCQATHNPELPANIWACEYRCGFYLNFDPKLAGLHRSVKWRKFIVSYTVGPSPDREWKDPPPLIPSGP